MEINNLASSSMSINKASVGQEILTKTLQKTAEAQQQQQQQNRQMQMQVQKPEPSSTVAAMTGKGTKIDTYV